MKIIVSNEIEANKANDYTFLLDKENQLILVTKAEFLTTLACAMATAAGARNSARMSNGEFGKWRQEAIDFLKEFKL